MDTKGKGFIVEITFAFELFNWSQIRMLLSMNVGITNRLRMLSHGNVFKLEDC